MPNPYDNFSTNNGGFNNGAPNDWSDNEDSWEVPNNDSWNDAPQEDWDSQSQDNWDSQSQDNFGMQGQYQQDDWNIPAPQQGKFNGANMQNDVQPNFENNYENQFNVNNPVKESNLSTKKVAFVLVGVLLVFILIFNIFNKIHFKKKVEQVADAVVDAQIEATYPSGQSNQSSQPADVNTQEVVQQSNLATNSQVGVGFISVPEGTPINYSVDVLETSGIVKKKQTYIQGSQLVYCLEINVAVGAASQTLYYYCNYASFNAVKEGDMVFIKYQQVSDSFISISEIRK